ncbi:hypothetical protein XENORESO_006261 [Xenotaenia resolanae]|uniref:Uncharacterized protein n=1 Tax=Xenotaenia resolanae TaxID=208358 RepID=A0ABV0XAM5_9TELE
MEEKKQIKLNIVGSIFILCRTSFCCSNSYVSYVSTTFAQGVKFLHIFVCKIVQAQPGWEENICKHQFSSLITDRRLDLSLDFHWAVLKPEYVFGLYPCMMPPPP